MSFRTNEINVNKSSVSALMKCGLNCIILSYLLCNLLLAAVMAVPEVAPLSDGLIPQHNSVSDLTLMKLDKRAASRYNFGIGKKFDYSQDLIENQSEDTEDSIDEMASKRVAPQNRFQFGLGKRAKTEQRFAFGLGKRKPYDNRFQFGLGKRAVPRDSRFGFGLGKRDFEDYIKRRYSFGLGKRSPNESHDYYYSNDSSERP